MIKEGFLFNILIHNKKFVLFQNQKIRSLQLISITALQSLDCDFSNSCTILPAGWCQYLGSLFCWYPYWCFKFAQTPLSSTTNQTGGYATDPKLWILNLPVNFWSDQCINRNTFGILQACNTEIKQFSYRTNWIQRLFI